MRTVDFLEYRIDLSTGESMDVAEVDSGLFPPLADPVVLRLSDDFLSRCTVAPRAAVEDAKSGYPEALEPFLGTPARGCLLRVSRQACADVGSCAISSRTRCLTSYSEKGRPAFPTCWTASVPDGGTEGQAAAARSLCESVVDAWREGRTVIVVRG